MERQSVKLEISLEELFGCAILLYEDEYLKKHGRELAMDWFRLQLSRSGLYTAPSGMSWAVKCTKEQFEDYMNSHYKIDLAHNS
jgi:hypothetical protein